MKALQQTWYADTDGDTKDPDTAISDCDSRQWLRRQRGRLRRYKQRN